MHTDDFQRTKFSAVNKTQCDGVARRGLFSVDWFAGGWRDKIFQKPDDNMRQAVQTS